MTTSNRPTQLADNNGAILPHTATDDILNISKFGTANIVIVGYARPGSGDDEARWKIYYNTYDASGNIVRMRLAEGINDYSHIWSAVTGKVITLITAANPAVVTSAGHNLVTGDFIEMLAITGMDELESDGYGSKVYHITRLNADTFSLQDALTLVDINSGAYVAYTSDGVAYKYQHLQYAWS